MSCVWSLGIPVESVPPETTSVKAQPPRPAVVVATSRHFHQAGFDTLV
jgi:hypothetical protein